MPLNETARMTQVQEFVPRYYFPQFQPVVDVTTGLIVGYECLMRCIDKHSNTVSASWLLANGQTHSWIQLAIDRNVRHKALRRFAHDKSAGQLFINISPRLLESDASSLRQPTAAMVKELGICPSRIVLEITEIGSNIELVHNLIRAYKRSGFKVAISDFSLDARELTRLVALKPDYLKLHLADFRRIETASRQNPVVLALGLKSANRQLEIICEGVETEEDFFLAIDCGASKIKGWLFGAETTLLLERERYQTYITSLKERHASEKKLRLQRYIAQKTLWANWLKLIASHHLSQRVHKLRFDILVKAGVLRYFICDIEGKQIGASIHFRPNGYIHDNSYEGKNWSHRPYFATALGLLTMQEGRYLLSTIYADELTGRSCMTMSFKIGARSILFMDVHVDDQALKDDKNAGLASAVKLARIK